MSDIDLSAPEVRAAIEAAVEKATAPLVAKRDELLGEVRKLRKGAEIDPAELERVEAERDELKAKLSAADKALGKATKDLEAATKRAEDTDAAFSNSLKDAALTEALTKAGVPVAMLGAVKAYHAGKLQVADDNGTRVIKAGDKALGDFITEWAASDEGKHFIAAPDTSGGGAHNGRTPTNPNAPKLTRTEFNALAPPEQMAHIQKQGVVVDA